MLSLETPRGTLTIRPVRESDLDAFRELRLRALREHPEAFASDFEESRSKPSEFWIERIKADPSKMTYIVQEPRQNNLVALAGIYRQAGVKLHHAADIWGVYVQPEWRGLRLSDSLVAACLHWARERQVRIVRLSVITTNEAAIRSYLRCGFQRDGYLPEFIHANGRYYDEYMMSRRIVGDFD